MRCFVYFILEAYIMALWFDVRIAAAVAEETNLASVTAENKFEALAAHDAIVETRAATNPFKNGYFQGDHLAPLEAVMVCPGIFGEGAYPGYPGNLMADKISKASYNAYGTNGRKFLHPAIRELTSSKCKDHYKLANGPSTWMKAIFTSS
ncbi:protein exordium [Quercus suber]|uniref:Protein exordium n=1 Tax=Quercus suber TaxID=58331 RepID=A0AAW0LY23_QUESU